MSLKKLLLILGASLQCCPFATCQVSFLLEAKENYSVFHINFQGSQFTSNSTVSMNMIPLKTSSGDATYQSYVDQLLHHNCVVDVFSLNGARSSKLKPSNLINGKNVADLVPNLHHLQTSPFKDCLKVFVVDFRATSKRYDNYTDIQNAELAIEGLFSKVQTPKKLKTHTEEFTSNLEKHNVQFFYGEGSLKATLLSKAFTEEQGKYLEEQPEGKGLLCEIGEVLMHGFKTGRYVQLSSGFVIHPKDYIFKGPAPPVTIKPATEGQIYSLTTTTIYEPHYKDLYGASGDYYKALSSSDGFKANYQFNPETKITSISLAFQN